VKRLFQLYPLYDTSLYCIKYYQSIYVTRQIVFFFYFAVDISILAFHRLLSREDILLFTFLISLFFRWEFIFKKGTEFWFRTNYKAKKFRIVMWKLVPSDKRKGEGMEGVLVVKNMI
jgi:hypothetical protein